MFAHGKNAYFDIDDSGGTSRNLSTFTNSVQGLPGGRGLSPTPAFGDQGARNIPGLANVQFTIQGTYDGTATTGPADVLNGLRTTTATSTFHYGPDSDTSGRTRYYGECWLTELTFDASVENAVTYSATFQVDGVVSTDTF